MTKFLVLGLTLLSLAACETTKGAGKDISKAGAAISDAGGVASFNLVAPVANVVSAAGHMPIFAPVTYA